MMHTVTQENALATAQRTLCLYGGHVLRGAYARCLFSYL